MTSVMMVTMSSATRGPRSAEQDSWWRRTRVWWLVAMAYLSVFPYSPGINNPNENVRVYMTRALVESHELAINKVEAEWGWVNDKAKSGARLLSSKAPGTSLLGVPVLAAQTWLWHRIGWRSPTQLATTLGLRLFAVMLPVCGFLYAFVRYARRLSGSQDLADLLLVGIGLGSLLYPYGIHFVGHTLAAALSFGAFMILAPNGSMPRHANANANANATTTSTKIPRSGSRSGSSFHLRAALAGLLCGLAVVFEYQNLVVAALLTFYVAARNFRVLGTFLLGALPAAILLGVIHQLCFGRPWAFPYGHLENLDFQAQHMRGFHGLGMPSFSAFVGILFQPGFGFLVCSPFLAVAVLATGALVVRRPRAEGLLFAAVAIALVIFLAGIPNWHGGWSVGPRYIATTVPFLAISLAYVGRSALVGQRALRWTWPVLCGLVLIGILMNAPAAVIYPQYPTQLRNPIFQLVLPLPGEGYLPYSLGYALGLRGALSLAPSVVPILGAVGIVLAAQLRQHARGQGPGGARRWLAPVLALAICAGFAVPFSRWPGTALPSEKDAITLVKSRWTPPPAATRTRTPTRTPAPGTAAGRRPLVPSLPSLPLLPSWKPAPAAGPTAAPAPKPRRLPAQKNVLRPVRPASGEGASGD